MRARPGRWFRTPDGRLRAPWRLLLVGVAFVVVIYGLTVAADDAGLPVDPTRATGPALAAALGVLVGNGVAVTILVLLAARTIDRRVLADVGWRFDGRTAPDVAAGLAVGVGLVGAAYAVGIAVGVYEPAVDPAAPPGYPFGVWLAVLAAAMIAVGVSEELLLRGYVLTNLAEGFTAVLGPRRAVAAAVGCSSVAFGLLHGLNPSASRLSLATITLAGVMLALGYVGTRSLAFPVGIHVAWNLAQVLVGLPVSGLDVPVRLVRTTVTGDALVHGGAFGPEGGLVGLGMTVAGCLVTAAYGRLRGGSVEPIAAPALGERA
jgi:membrane protease YdiL (CAAX protease family)